MHRANASRPLSDRLLFTTLLAVALGGCAGQTGPGGARAQAGPRRPPRAAPAPDSAGNGSAAGSGAGGTTAGTSGATGSTGATGGRSRVAAATAARPPVARGLRVRPGRPGPPLAPGERSAPQGQQVRPRGAAAVRPAGAAPRARRPDAAAAPAAAAAEAAPLEAARAEAAPAAPALRPRSRRPPGRFPTRPAELRRSTWRSRNWQKGLISPSMQGGHQINQPTVINGYLDDRRQRGVLDPRRVEPGGAEAALQLHDAQPHRRRGREPHVSYARYGNTFYMVTIGGNGINIWDVTSRDRAQAHQGGRDSRARATATTPKRSGASPGRGSTSTSAPPTTASRSSTRPIPPRRRS